MSLPILSLKRRGAELANAREQVKVLEGPSDHPRFDDFLRSQGLSELKADGIDILQVNVGKLCNMTCQHCHVDAGPDRKEENMDRETVDLCLEAIKKSNVKTVDLTGGAPEMNANFKYFVTEAKS